MSHQAPVAVKKEHSVAVEIPHLHEGVGRNCGCSIYINSTFSFGHPQSGLLLVRAVALVKLTQMPS